MIANARRPRKRAEVKRRVMTNIIPIAASLAPPAVRSLILTCSATSKDGEWSTHHHVYPVLSITATVRHTYTRYKESEESPAIAPTHEAMDELGWHFDSAGCDYAPLVYCPDYRMILEADELLGDVVNLVYQFAACDWHPSEDDDRLAEIREELAEQAIEKAKRWEAKTAQTGGTK